MKETCLIPAATGVSLIANQDFTIDCIVNGFSLEQTIFDMLMEHAEVDWFAKNIEKQDVSNLAQAITKSLATKLRLKQEEL